MKVVEEQEVVVAVCFQLASSAGRLQVALPELGLRRDGSDPDVMPPDL